MSARCVKVLPWHVKLRAELQQHLMLEQISYSDVTNDCILFEKKKPSHTLSLTYFPVFLFVCLQFRRSKGF